MVSLTDPKALLNHTVFQGIVLKAEGLQVARLHKLISFFDLGLGFFGVESLKIVVCFIGLEFFYCTKIRLVSFEFLDLLFL